MTDAYLLPIGTAALLFPALAFVMFVPTAIVLYRRHGVMTRWRVLSLYGGVYYALTAFCMVIVPLPKPSVDVCKKYPSFAEPQFTPGVAVSDIWKEAHHRVTLDALILHNSAFWQTVFNLILLLPLGMLVRVHFRRGLAAATAVGFAASLLFELTQYSGLWGLYECPYRLFAVDDLIANTAGAALGWALAGPLARMLPTLDALDDRALAAGKVPFGRRLVALVVDVAGVELLIGIAAGIASAVLGEGAVLWLPPAVFALWFVVIPWRTGATPGKHLLRLRLATVEGEPPSLAALALRAAVLSPPLVIVGLVGVAAFPVVFMGFAADAALHDPSGSSADTSALIDMAGEMGYQAVSGLMTGPGIVLLLFLAGCLTLIGAYVRAVRRHPSGLGPHETLSGVRNHALPHTRARTRPETPRPAEAPDPAPLAAAADARTGG
ncbi:RDD family protein [Streptomyces sp. 2333.5]|uniref:VanZ family protein n=1 Tax=unclassified Streptomyces TaxID=2593676 RepID=UPI00089ABA66|nr:MULTISPECIES: VanZ family protein [unclassified Streptomyces]PJJ02957.1 RDD family protein [Streptomyces sp. 2333.5]SED66137.1 RDD family protein [Streptomyces sp. 2314.4]SEE23256.1 RDD family protein [Streptomyces sp. 2112.2]